MLLLGLAPPALAQRHLLVSAHGAGGKRFKGQLHCHTSNSDGKQTPTALTKAYLAAGYGFVVLSDHLKRTADPKVAGITVLPGSEVHDLKNQQHVNAIGIRSGPGDWDRRTVKAILARVARAGGIAMANHPRVQYRWPAELLRTARPLQLVSIFNGRGYDKANQTIPGAGSLLMANVAHWDDLLRRGRFLWGTANDDCHDATNPAWFNQGWVLVRAASRKPGDLLRALRGGDFFACRGPQGRAPSLTLTVRRQLDGAGWEAIARSRPTSKLRWIAGGKVVARGRGRLRYVPKGDEGYLRAEAEDAQEPDARSYGQPIRVVRRPRLSAAPERTPGRWRLRFQDGRGVRVVLRQPLRLEIRGGRVERALKLLPGSSEYVVRLKAGERVVPDPASGWPATRAAAPRRGTPSPPGSTPR